MNRDGTALCRDSPLNTTLLPSFFFIPIATPYHHHHLIYNLHHSSCFSLRPRTCVTARSHDLWESKCNHKTLNKKVMWAINRRFPFQLKEYFLLHKWFNLSSFFFSVLFQQSWYLGELSSIPSVERDSDSANKCPPELQHKHHWWASGPRWNRELNSQRQDDPHPKGGQVDWDGGGVWWCTARTTCVLSHGWNQQAAHALQNLHSPSSSCPSSHPKILPYLPVMDTGREDKSWSRREEKRSASGLPSPCPVHTSTSHQSVVVFAELSNPFKYCDV